LKRSPLSDIAGMLRSFQYLGAYFLKEKVLRPEDKKVLSSFVEHWVWWISSEYLKSYLELITPQNLLPKDRVTLQKLLNVYCLEKALYELSYELSSRPDWVDIPVQGILELLGERSE